MPLGIGTVVDDRYRVVACVGAGSSGTVYEVEDLAFLARLTTPKTAASERSRAHAATLP